MTVATFDRRDRLVVALLLSLLIAWPLPPLDSADAMSNADANAVPAGAANAPNRQPQSTGVQKALRDKGYPPDAIVVPVLWRPRSGVIGDYEPLKYINDTLAEDEHPLHCPRPLLGSYVKDPRPAQHV